MLARMAMTTVLTSVLATACSPSTSDDDTSTVAATEETGDQLVPQAGVYQATITRKTGACRAESESDSWKLTLPLPEASGAFEMTEEYAGDDPLRQAPYPCNLDTMTDLVICGISKDRDYGAEDMGVAANVTAKRYFELQWTKATELSGIVQADLRCEGSNCDDEPATTYLVNEWDCLTEAEFDAVLVE